jgi:hypothetical protein
MSRRETAIRLIPTAVLFAAILACSFPSKMTLLSPATETPVSVTSTSSPYRPQPEDYKLLNPSTGLDRLGSYLSHLSISFKGTRNGQPYVTTTNISRAVIRDLPADVTTLDAFDQTGAPFHLFSGNVGGTHYLQFDPNQPCQIVDGSVNSPGAVGPDQGTSGNPVAMLPAVYGAQPINAEQMSGIPSNHYRFSENSVPLARNGAASGDIWIALNGGYVVSYQLTVQAPLGVLGVGLAGEQTWLYDLTQPTNLKDILLPPGCPQVLLDLPVLADAVNLEHMPGFMQYSSHKSSKDAVIFYQNQLKASGWQLQQTITISKNESTLIFVKPTTPQLIVSIGLLEQNKVLLIKIQEIEFNPNPTPIPTLLQISPISTPTATPTKRP